MTICFSLIAGCLTVKGQDTFSIVAVDTLTGEIGSAGASCVGPINGVGAFILSDVIEGVGAIHTQAFWSPVNQQNAHARMLAPGDFRLYPNYPNPFNPETVISYQFSVVSDAVLNIYNLLGEKIITLVAKRQPAGIYRVSWDGRDERERLMPSGVYFSQLRVNGDVRTVRMVLAR